MQTNGRYSEHLATWLREVRQLAVLIELWDLVEKGDRSRLRQYVSWEQNHRRVALSCGWTTQGRGRLVPIRGQTLTISNKGTFDQVGQPITFTEGIIAVADTPSGEDALSYWRDGEVIGPAKYYVIKRTNEKLAGHVNPTVLAFGENRLYFQPDSLLILDDFAMREYTVPQAEDLYELISRRYRRGALILTTNRAPADLYPLFPNPVLAEGLLDRLLNSAPLVTMLGRSYRPRQRPSAGGKEGRADESHPG